MSIIVAVVAAVVTGAIVAAIVVAAMRRVAAPPAADPGDDLRAIQHDLGRLMGRLDSGFDQTARDHGTVRSALDLLTHDGGRRGTWGEVTLRRLLETAGLVHRVDFDTQRTLPGGGRPDVLIDLGEAGTVVIDAKAPLADLRRAWEADDDGERDAALRAHVATVKRHAADLVDRDYPSLLRTTFAPVVMYLPVDGAWEAAAATAPDLAGELQRLGVHPASPSTLGLVLDLVKHHALTVNQEAAVREILEDTRELLGRLATHTGHLEKMGRALEGAVTAYNSGVGNLATRVVPSLDRMAGHLGARTPSAPEPVTTVVQADRVAPIESPEGRVA